MQSILTRGSVVAFLVLAMAVPAQAGGFQVLQQGARASGRGGAFTASADDASATYYNPAAVLKLEGFHLYLGGGISMPDISFSGPTGSADMEEVVTYPAQAYFTAQLSDNYSLAFGAWIPYDLKTYWESDVTAPYALKTSWTSRLYNANVVARINPSWSLALGLEWIDFQINDFSRKYDFTGLQATNPSVLFPPPEPLNAETNATFSGDKFGANLALHYHNEESGYSFGASFRSRKIVRMQGYVQWNDVSEATFTRVGTTTADQRWIDVPPPGSNMGNGQRGPTEPWWILLNDKLARANGVGTPSCPPEPAFCPMGHAFTGSPATMTVQIPGTIQVGFGRDGHGNWDWEVDLLWTQWSGWNTNFEVTEPNGIYDAQQNFYSTTSNTDLGEDWRDTWALSAGFDYHITESHAVRGGLMWDPSPVKEDVAKPYLPDSNRIGLTAGYGYRSGGGHYAVDLYGQYFIHDDTVASEGQNPNVLQGTYETSSYTLGASMGFHF